MPNYDFKSLSDRDFEKIIRDLLQAEFSTNLESFKAGRDGGIDLRGILHSKYFIVQCKHYASSKISNLKSTLKHKEAPKLASITPIPSRYILATSLPLSPKDKDDIMLIMSPFVKSPSDVYGQEDINNLLNKYPKVEKSHFKLWLSSSNILERIFNSSSYNKSIAHQDSIRNKINRYVLNESYSDAIEILEKDGFIIISGQPGVGKTTLADILSYHYIVNDFEFVCIFEDKMDEAFSRFKIDEKIIFYFDDFLGQTYLGDLSQNFNAKNILLLIDMVKSSPNSKLIMTTREYILQSAKKKHEKIQNSEIDISKYTLNIESYTRNIKAEILYNHLYFSNMNNNYIYNIISNRNYLNIIDHPNYNPRLIETMTSVTSISHITPNLYYNYFIENLDNPEKLWNHSFENQISFEAQSLILICASIIPHSQSLTYISLSFEAAYPNLCRYSNREIKKNAFKSALKEVDGTFLLTLVNDQSKTSQKISIYFRNPSVRDFLQNWLKYNLDDVFSIMNNAITFSQINTLMNEAFQSDAEIINCEKFRFHSQKILDKIIETTDSGKYNKINEIKYIDRKWSNIKTISRIGLICDIAKIEKILNKKIDDIDFSETLESESISNWADAAQYIAKSEHISNKIGEKILSNLIENSFRCSSLEDFTNVIKLKNNYLFTEDYIENISSAFESHDYEYELSGLQSSSELNDFKESWDEIIGELGLFLYHDPEGFEQALQYAYDAEDHEADSTDWERGSNHSNAGDDAIDQLFSSFERPEPKS